MVNREVNRELNNLKKALIKDLNNKSIEYIDLIAYNRAKNILIAKKYYGD